MSTGTKDADLIRQKELGPATEAERQAREELIKGLNHFGQRHQRTDGTRPTVAALYAAWDEAATAVERAAASWREARKG